MFDSLSTTTQALAHSLTHLVLHNAKWKVEVDRTFSLLLPPRRRDDWTSGLSQTELYRLRRTLKIPEIFSMGKILRNRLGDATMPPALKKKLHDMRSHECAATLELPSKSKSAIPLEATEDDLFSLVLMPNKIQNKLTDILVMIDHADIILNLIVLFACRALSVFSTLLYHWIETFNSPHFELVEERSFFAAELMRDIFHKRPFPALADSSRTINGYRA